MQEELPLPGDHVVGPRPLRVLRDVGPHQPRRLVLDLDERVAELNLARANRLHLGAHEHDPRLELLEHVELSGRFLVLRNDLHRPLTFIVGSSHPLF